MVRDGKLGKFLGPSPGNRPVGSILWDPLGTSPVSGRRSFRGRKSVAVRIRGRWRPPVETPMGEARFASFDRPARAANDRLAGGGIPRSDARKSP